MKISNDGRWLDKNPKHFFDIRLSNHIYKLIEKKNIKSLVDFGCGDCKYIKQFINNELYCEGYDGNPYTEKISDGIGKILNLIEEIKLDKKFDCVLSLEVGEHIPFKYEQIFIDNITKHSSKLIILSWATPNQGGDGHFNERDNNYIINKIEDKKFKFNKEETINLREECKFNWFKNTIMVFEK